jgi:hypothetical protein
MHMTTSECVFTIISILLNVALFAYSQSVAIRRFRPRRLLLFSLVLFVLSTLVFFFGVFIVCNDYFYSYPSFPNYAAIVVVGSIGHCGLVTFLGPATADRSATAHLLTFLSEQGRSISSAELIAAFAADEFIRKRLAECTEAKILDLEGGAVSLSGKGRALARIYAWINRRLNIEYLPEHRYSFRR